MTKYGAKLTEVDGIVFASQAEARRYGELKLMLAAGAISQLEIQPRYDLVVEGVKIGTYVGDFAYVEDGRYVLEDVKSPATITPVYRLKRKLVKALYGLEIKEVFT